ncbi:MAG: GyrI-like domain-containing protein [Candidatus Bathyarchaeota archaeon]|nr:GyrI-like domain-containing protein [Candidatus Bathyarchaeota archaeon]
MQLHQRGTILQFISWYWKSMIRQPDFVNMGMLKEVRSEVREKRGSTIDLAVLEIFHEGLCAQIMHRSPYNEENPTIMRLQEFIMNEGYRMRGYHHEIYLSDPRRSNPENIKTIIS